jgi:hypothetical protein
MVRLTLFANTERVKFDLSHGSHIVVLSLRYNHTIVFSIVKVFV